MPLILQGKLIFEKHERFIIPKKAISPPAGAHSVLNLITAALEAACVVGAGAQGHCQEPGTPPEPSPEQPELGLSRCWAPSLMPELWAGGEAQPWHLELCRCAVPLPRIDGLAPGWIAVLFLGILSSPLAFPGRGKGAFGTLQCPGRGWSWVGCEAQRGR